MSHSKHTTVQFINTSVPQQAHNSPTYKHICLTASTRQSNLQIHMSYSKQTTVQFTDTSVPHQVHNSSVDSHIICRNLHISSTAMSPDDNSLPAVGPWPLLKHFERLFLNFYSPSPINFNMKAVIKTGLQNKLLKFEWAYKRSNYMYAYFFILCVLRINYNSS